jgi:hypothetical protein
MEIVAIQLVTYFAPIGFTTVKFYECDLLFTCLILIKGAEIAQSV